MQYGHEGLYTLLFQETYSTAIILCYNDIVLSLILFVDDAISFINKRELAMMVDMHSAMAMGNQCMIVTS